MESDMTTCACGTDAGPPCPCEHGVPLCSPCGKCGRELLEDTRGQRIHKPIERVPDFLPMTTGGLRDLLNEAFTQGVSATVKGVHAAMVTKEIEDTEKAVYEVIRKAMPPIIDALVKKAIEDYPF